jgi:uncharacterized protein
MNAFVVRIGLMKRSARPPLRDTMSPMSTRPFLLALAILLPLPAQREPTPVVDHHQHLFSAAIAARSSGVEPIDAARLVRLLDGAGIRQALVLSLAYQYGNPNRPPVENEYDRVKAENDWTSEQAARFPDRLRAFCSVNPLKAYALEEIARCAKDPRLRIGLKMHFGNSDVDLANAQHVARLRELFRAANGHGMAIVVHLRSTISKKRPYGAAYARVFLEDLLPAAPGVPVQIAHLAGAGGYDDPLVDEALGVFVSAIATGDARMKRVYFDVSGVAGLGEWKRQATLIAARIREIGVVRILYGSDGAGGGNATPREAWTAFKRLPLSDAEFRTIETNTAPYVR